MGLGSIHDQVSREQVLKLDDFFLRLQRTMHTQVQIVMQRFHMTASQVFILRYVDKHGPTKASDIAKSAGLSPGAVTQVCDELVRIQCIDRTRSDDDRRVVYIEATDVGRDRLNEIRQTQLSSTERILEQLGLEDAENFVRIVGRVVEIAEKEAMPKR